MSQQNNLWDDRPYRPTSVTISIDEWDRMNKELEELRTKVESYENDLEIIGKVWFSKRDKDALLEGLDEPSEEQREYLAKSKYQWNLGKHDRTQDPSTNALLPLMELKMAVDRGETIVDDNGNRIRTHSIPVAPDVKYAIISGIPPHNMELFSEWDGLQRLMAQSFGWRIEPPTEPEPDNYSEILAELHLGKTFQAEDGTEIWKRRNDGATGVGMGIALIAPWSDVVEQILKRHKGWKKV